MSGLPCKLCCTRKLNFYLWMWLPSLCADHSRFLYRVEWEWYGGRCTSNSYSSSMSSAYEDNLYKIYPKSTLFRILSSRCSLNRCIHTCVRYMCFLVSVCACSCGYEYRDACGQRPFRLCACCILIYWCRIIVYLKPLFFVPFETMPYRPSVEKECPSNHWSNLCIVCCTAYAHH